MATAGQKRDDITIQEKVSGAYRDLYVDVPAYIKPLVGRERYQAEQVAAQVDTRIELEYLPGIEPSARVLCGSQVFLVKAAIDPTRLQQELVLDCQEVFNV